ncbi:DUF4168 domain-containing protein [Nostoc sp.]|uniref:DUF4168 domain-containing protein n=1 Tax=Nostoc sp. TaxID=1180 RepID=UPI002FF78176
MKKISDLFSRPSRKRILFQSFFFGAIATVGVISNAFSLSSKAYAQTPPPIVNNTDTEIESYAQAVLAMEPARQNAFEEIKKLIGNGEIPNILCYDYSSINGLPKKAQDIAVNYCTSAQKIVEKNGLTFEQFNKITIELLNNNIILKQQISDALLRLQKPRESR